MKTSQENQKRPVGRPRADGKAHLDRAELLKTTAKLISARGYGGTSMRKIAAELDVSVASIFNLFPSKVELLNSLVEFVAQPSFEFYDRLADRDLSPPLALLKSILEEVRAVSTVDREFIAVFYLPELRQSEFGRAQAVREKMVAHYAKLVSAGVKAGDFVEVQSQWVAEQIFQLTETSIFVGPAKTQAEADQRASDTAKFCLRSLMVKQSELDLILRDARDVDLKIDTEV